MSNWNKSAEQWRGAWSASKRALPKPRVMHGSTGERCVDIEAIMNASKADRPMVFSHRRDGIDCYEHAVCGECGFFVCSPTCVTKKAPEQQKPATKLLEGSREWATEQLKAGKVLAREDGYDDVRWRLTGGEIEGFKQRWVFTGISIEDFAKEGADHGWLIADDTTPSAAPTTPAKMNGEQAVAWMLANPGKETLARKSDGSVAFRYMLVSGRFLWKPEADEKVHWRRWFTQDEHTRLTAALSAEFTYEVAP